LVTRSDFYEITGYKPCSNADGQCDTNLRIFWIKQNQNVLETKDTIWHEILHCLYPNLPEWWIECSAYKLSRNNHWSYGVNAQRYNKTPRESVPSRRLLIEMIESTSWEMFKKYCS
jgi:hypothetical protein